MLLTGKRALVLGVANEDSLAWHVAQGMKRAGAIVHIGYQQRFRSRVLQLLSTTDVPPDGAHRCDVTQASEVAEVVQGLGGPVDVLVHSIAFSPASAFTKTIHDIDAAEFAQTLEISAYSLLTVAKASLSMLAPSASIMTMTYLGAQRVTPGYRVMGVAKAALEAIVRELAAELGPQQIRVNAISAGPIRTLASQAIPGFGDMLDHYSRVAPLRSLVEPDDVADLAVFLGSDLSRRITGQVIFVDAGYSILAVAKG